MKDRKQKNVGVIGHGYVGTHHSVATTTEPPMGLPMNTIISKLNEATDSIRAFTRRISATATDLDILRSTIDYAKYPKKSKHSKAAALRFKARHKK